MGVCTLANLRGGRLEYSPGAKLVNTPPYTVNGDLTMSASYAAGGDTLDLSAYFDEIHEVLVEDDLTYGLEYIAGSTTANGTVKAYQSKTVAHTHGLLVKGGQTAGKLVCLDSTAAILSKFATGIAGGRVAGPASYVTGGFALNLASVFDIAGASPPNVTVVCESTAYRGIYIQGADGASGVVKVYARDNVKGGRVLGPASYATGGFTLDLSASFTGIPNVAVTMSGADNYKAAYVPGTGAADGKIIVTVGSTGVEVAATTNLGAVYFEYVGIGTSIEVAATTNLSTIFFQYTAVGPVATTGDVTLIGGTNNNQNNAAVAAAAEVAAATNLSTITVPVRISGKQKSS